MLSQVIQQTGAAWLLLAAAGVAVISYCLGCFNGAVVVSKYILRDDVRTHGSGNAGLTNFYRSFGGPLTVAVIVADMLKAVLALLLASYVAGQMSPGMIPLAKYWAGMFCMLGHMYPCMFQFRGGKGVLSGGTIAIMADWRAALIVWGVFLIVFLITRYVSLGACCAGVSFPIAAALVFQDGLVTLIAAIPSALLLWKHRGNIKRLIRKEEPKFAFRKKKKEGEPEGETVEVLADTGAVEGEAPVEEAAAAGNEEPAATSAEEQA